ncbi:2-oxoisovalerate dehydrogenase E1 [Mycobacterium mantenii]|uniref:dihydrolipoyllysine-residue succinyltransferase n=3 Tax=Mycobacterium mantenii TaxID=560555 RepID=A0ABM7JR50_MYCNT|nr:2-oxoisovalerate dehydrogenase E1 [Mycobacterium mantenii]
MSGSFSTDELLEMYYRMLLIRNFEQRTSRLYAEGQVPGFVHLSIGQEASAVGTCWPLRSTDGIVSNHRGHGHCLAKGADPTSMFGELMGRAIGTGGGMGGSMHIADFDRGIYGANGIVGAGLPIAVGVAEGFRQQNRDDVVVAFFGDGAIAQGAFHEAVNLAAVRGLPVLFVCENNQYSEFSSFDEQHPVPVTARASAYGIDCASVDGNDVVAVAAAAMSFVSRMRAGEGPFLLETITYRWHGHYEGDPMPYRTDAELAQWKERDPIAALASALRDRVDRPAMSSVEARAERVTAEAETAASGAAPPDPSMLSDAVEVGRVAAAPARLEPVTADGDRGFKVMHAVHAALEYSLQTDPTVFVAGVDVGGGNVFGLTRGLRDSFGQRVFDTPISESAVVGLAVGAAMTGCKPIVEIMYFDFIGVAFDQIMNQAAKIHFMTGGRAPAALVIRTQFGSGRSSAAQHSQSLEALLSHIPGLTVVMPSTAEDTYGLLRAAIMDPNPVIFVEHRLQYGLKGIRPDPDYVVPLGQAAIRRQGCDVTLVSWSRMAQTALAAANQIASEGIDVEVIDLRTVAPFDLECVLRSVRKTNRLVIAHEAHGKGGLGAEIAAQIADIGVWHLDAPIKRVTPPFTPAPYSPDLEQIWLPGPKQIIDAIREVVADK